MENQEKTLKIDEDLHQIIKILSAQLKITMKQVIFCAIKELESEISKKSPEKVSKSLINKGFIE